MCLSNNGNCQHVCNSLNTNGYCTCYFGYILNDDNHTCKPGITIFSSTYLLNMLFYDRNFETPDFIPFGLW